MTIKTEIAAHKDDILTASDVAAIQSSVSFGYPTPLVRLSPYW